MDKLYDIKSDLSKEFKTNYNTWFIDSKSTINVDISLKYERKTSVFPNVDQICKEVNKNKNIINHELIN